MAQCTSLGAIHIVYSVIDVEAVNVAANSDCHPWSPKINAANSVKSPRLATVQTHCRDATDSISARTVHKSSSWMPHGSSRKDCSGGGQTSPHHLPYNEQAF